MKFGSKTYYDDYYLRGFDTQDFNNDGTDEIFVISYHRPDWPTQLVLLDYQGKKIGEYWNAGQLDDYLVTDLDDDGKKELIAVGLNNEYRQGCLLAFDPQKVTGGSPQTEADFISPDLGRGSELYYVLFPRTDVDLAGHSVEYESIVRIRQVDDIVFRLDTFLSGIFFFLDHRFVVRDITFSHQFMRFHNEARRNGLIVSVLDEEYGRKLKAGLLYFDGASWSSKPTPQR